MVTTKLNQLSLQTFETQSLMPLGERWSFGLFNGLRSFGLRSFGLRSFGLRSFDLQSLATGRGLGFRWVTLFS